MLRLFCFECAKIFFMRFLINMIYSIVQHKEIPVSIQKEVYYVDEEFGNMIRYVARDDSKKINVGRVDLQDTKNGVKVVYIKNYQPKLYKHFAQLADQIEVEHCLKRGIDKPYIKSTAARDTYVLHFLRGKRFINEGINIYLDFLTRKLQKGEQVITEFLGYQKMYMPTNMIDKIKEKIKINPLLKGIK